MGIDDDLDGTADLAPALVPAGTGRRLMDGPLGAELLAGSATTGGSAAFVVHDLAL